MEKFSQNRTHCPILNTCFEVYFHIINDLCFWHGFGKYKGEESQAVRLRNRTAATENGK